HHHLGGDLLYRHPLIRYGAGPDGAVVAGLAEGALLLRGLPAPDTLVLGGERHPVIGHTSETTRVGIGPTRVPVGYLVRTPYLALTRECRGAGGRGGRSDRRGLLERVIVGNLLSLSKAVGLHVGERLRAEADLEPDGWHELKPGVRLLGFRGTFRVNFAVPDG